MTPPFYTDSEYQKVPFTIWGIFRFGLHLVKENIIPLVLVTAIMAVPSNIIAEYILSYGDLPIREGIAGLQDISNVYKVSGFIFVMIGYIAGISIIREFLVGKTMKVEEALLSGLRLLVPVLWTSILYGLCVIGGTLLLIIPGIIISIWFSFSIYATIFHGISGPSALKYSKKLVEGRWWDTFGMSIGFGILTFLILGIPVIILGAFIGGVQGYLGLDGFVINTFFSVLIDVIAVPSTFVAVALFLAFERFQQNKAGNTLAEREKSL